MNICFISPEAPPYLSGGAGVATLNFSKVLVKKGFKVTIIARKLAGGQTFENVEGVEVFRLSCSKIRILMLSHIIFIIKSLFLLCKIHRKHPIDLLYAQTLISPGVISAIGKRLLDIPTIVHGRGIDIEKGFEGLKKPISLWVLRNNDYIFLLSNEHLLKTREILEQRAIRKELFELTNGVEINFKKSKEECKKELNLDPNILQIVYVGRLDQPKGLIYALQAIVDLKGIQLHILGEETGGKKQETTILKEFVRKNNLQETVIFHGVQPREDTYQFVTAADVFIHPLLIAAGMGNAVLEAMYLGTPVLGTNIGYFKEIIENGKSGLLVEPANPEQLKQAIIKLKNHPKLKERLAKEAKSKVFKEHNWENLAKKLETFLNAHLPKKEKLL